MRLWHPIPFRFLLQRLNDPQVQVWLMTGLAMVLLLIGHNRAWSPVGEGKNAINPTASRLLLAGAPVSWNDAFAPSQRSTSRPNLVLHSSPSRQRQIANRGSTSSKTLEVRSSMEAAASRPWQFLGRPLRQQLAQAAPAQKPLQASLQWSGDHRGNAALLAIHATRNHAPAAATFVIGNGSRSKDGEIEPLRPQFSFAGGRVDIILIGSGSSPTARQTSALGELLHQLEALTGHLLIADSPSAPPLAGYGPVELVSMPSLL